MAVKKMVMNTMVQSAKNHLIKQTKIRCIGFSDNFTKPCSSLATVSPDFLFFLQTDFSNSPRVLRQPRLVGCVKLAHRPRRFGGKIRGKKTGAFNRESL